MSDPERELSELRKRVECWEKILGHCRKGTLLYEHVSEELAKVRSDWNDVYAGMLAHAFKPRPDRKQA